MSFSTGPTLSHTVSLVIHNPSHRDKHPSGSRSVLMKFKSIPFVVVRRRSISNPSLQKDIKKSSKLCFSQICEKTRQNATRHCYALHVFLSFDEIFRKFPKLVKIVFLTFLVCSSTYFDSSSCVRVGVPLAPLAGLEEVLKGPDNLVKFRSLVKVPAILVFH